MGRMPSWRSFLLALIGLFSTITLILVLVGPNGSNRDDMGMFLSHNPKDDHALQLLPLYGSLSAVLDDSLKTLANVTLTFTNIHLSLKAFPYFKSFSAAEITAQRLDWIEVYTSADQFSRDIYRIPVTSWTASASGQFLNGTMSVRLANIRQFSYRFRYIVTVGGGNIVVAALNSNEVFSDAKYPAQVHISITGENAQDIRVMWSDLSPASSNPKVRLSQSATLDSYVEIPASTYSYQADMMQACQDNETVAIKMFMDPGMLHHADLTSLKQDTRYYYSCGSDDTGFGEIYSFVSPPAQSSDARTSFVMMADQGTSLCLDPVGGWCALGSWALLQSLSKKIQNDPRQVGIVFNSGDLSYAVGRAYRWDMWMNEILPVAANAPYMVSLGNHEFNFYQQDFRPDWGSYWNDSDGECGLPTRMRFLMPWNTSQDLIADAEEVLTSNWWYSFNYGSIHFTVISMENNFTKDSPQYNWIVDDLSKVNRSEFPWVVVTGHRPLYTSAPNATDDALEAEHLKYELEDVFMNYKVDLVLTGHYHQYERTCPVYNGTCYGSGEAPVHVIVGTAGIEKENDWGASWFTPPEWSLKRLAIFGYAQVEAHNSSALYFSLIDTESKDGDEVVDQFWILKS
eukprot:TRINITY_DN20779_c0_g2_i1.p1 TRINITY_DN20779_c0_g2~~TRINITY_DN20779_c0_g2_i1.p1  ORF type:complete len:627 (+),score=140.30 TRINITY_DN20779_c0_g2_i1:486-2366(+)